MAEYRPLHTAVALSSYGADASGLVYGYVFSADGKGLPIDGDSAAAWLAQSVSATPAAQLGTHLAGNSAISSDASQTGFVWLHFNGSHTSTLHWLQRHVDLPEEFFDSMRAVSRSTRIEHAHQSLIAIVNDVVYDLVKNSPLEVSTLWLHVGPRCLVSVRRQPLQSVDRLRAAVKAGEPFHSPLSLVIHLLRDQADVLIQIVRSTTETVDAIEDDFLAGRLPERASLGSIRRDLVRLQRLLAPEPAALFRLLNRPPDWVREEDAQDLQQSTEEFSVVLRDMAGLQERIKLLQEEIVARIGERTNRSVFVLTAVTVIALPINLTAGLFGMNVGGIPFSQHPEGFWVVVALVALFTAIAAWLAFRRGGE